MTLSLTKGRAVSIDFWGLTTSPSRVFAYSHFFLAKGGVDANAMNSTLNAINLKSTFEPFQPIHDTDTEVCTRSKQSQEEVKYV